MYLYTGYILIGSLAFAWWYGFSAYRGYFMPAALITAAFLLWTCIGEAFRPEKKRPWTVLVILVMGALTIFLFGHRFGYQRERASFLEREDGVKVGHAVSEQATDVVGAEFDIGNYISVLKTEGFWEKGPRRHGGRTEHVTGDEVMISLFFHLIMLVGSAGIVWRVGAGEFLDSSTEEDIFAAADAIPFPSMQPGGYAGVEQQAAARVTEVDNKHKAEKGANEPPWEIGPVEPLPVINGKKHADDLLAEVVAAVSDRHIDQLLAIAKRGVSPNLLDAHGVPLLSGLIRERAWTKAIQAFAENGIDPELADPAGNTMLHELSTCDRSGYGYYTWQDRPQVFGRESLQRMQQLAARIIASGGDVYRQNEKGVTPLMGFARFAEKSFFQFILNTDGDVDVQDADGRSALMIAAAGGEPLTEHLRLLIGKGADVELCDAKGATAADYAAGSGSVALISELLSERKQAADSEELGRMLLQAAKSGTPAAVKEIITRGASLACTDSDGKSALFLAAERPNLEMTGMLLEAGASPDGPAASRPPLQGALWGRDEAVLSALLAAGANPAIVDSHGRTPLTTAISFSWVRGLALLLEAGADPLAAPRGYSLYMALARSARMQTEERFAELVAFLSKLEVPATTVNEEGLTALCYLCGAYDGTEVPESENHTLLARHLVERGADPDFEGSEGTPRSLAAKKKLAGVLEIFDSAQPHSTQ